MDLDTVLRDLRAGNVHAGSMLGAWLTDQLTQYFSGWGFDEDATEELIQRTVLDILEKISDAPNNGDAFLNWALGFAWTEVLTIRREPLRAMGRAAKLAEVGELVETPGGPDAPVLEREQRELVEHHLRKLPPLYREALEFYLDTESYEALMSRFGIANSTARSRISKARRMLRESIEAARLTRSPFRTPSSAA